MTDYPRTPPGLTKDGAMFAAQLLDALERAARMTPFQQIDVAVRDLTKEQRNAYNVQQKQRRGKWGWTTSYKMPSRAGSQSRQSAYKRSSIGTPSRKWGAHDAALAAAIAAYDAVLL